MSISTIFLGVIGFCIGFFGSGYVLGHKSRTYEVVYKKSDGSSQRTEWLHRGYDQTMRALIQVALDRADEVDMAVLSITRIDK